MYEVLGLLTITSHGTLEEKVELLQQIFDTGQNCRAGVAFRPTVHLGRQVVTEDEMSLLLVSITRALSLFGLSRPLTYDKVRLLVFDALTSRPNRDDEEESDEADVLSLDSSKFKSHMGSMQLVSRHV